jgi:hypothetical protein
MSISSLHRLGLAAILIAGCSSTSSSPPPPPFAAGVKITQVALMQSLKSTLMKDGQPIGPDGREVPVVIGRDALLRVFLQPDATFVSRPVIVRLELTSNGQALAPMEVTLTPVPGQDKVLTSTANFELPGAQVTGDLTYAVSVRETDPKNIVKDGDISGTQFPADGTQIALSPVDTGEALKVVILPVRYMADGSGRLPDTSDAAIGRLRDLMFALYPVRKVEITVGEPFNWTTKISASGQGWDQLLQAVARARLRDGVPENVYYYGLFNPAPSLGQFCGRGCVLGLSSLAQDVEDNWARASIGLGYPDGFEGEDGAANTFVHEVGHAHGREHAPCMLGGQPSDPDYPYPNARIGVWGYDLLNKTLVDPEGRARDMMGYCSPQWISDYTYNALYARISALNLMGFRRGALTQRAGYRSYIVNADGTLSGGERVEITGVVKGRPKGIERLDAETGAVAEKLEGHFYPFDHLPGGTLLVPESVPVPADATLRIVH